MDAEYYFYLGLEAQKKGEFERAIDFYSKAELANGGKDASSSYNKGFLLVKRYELTSNPKDLDLAIDSYTKAEEGRRGIYPKASCDKGSALHIRYERDQNPQDLDLAIYYLEKAEIDNGGNYPLASLNKGAVLYDRYKLYKNPRDLDSAINSFTKAEKDNYGKSPEASFNKGLALNYRYKLYGNPKDLDLEIDSYTKAQEDNGGVFSIASLNKGNAFSNRYERDANPEDLNSAIESYTKAEEDNGGKFPIASFNKGSSLRDRYERDANTEDLNLAIDSYTKSEKDNGGKYSEASCNKGVIFLLRFERYGNSQDLDLAIDSFTKAEIDYNGKNPKASYNKGFIYKNYTPKTDKAIVSFTKAIHDSENHFYPKAHLELAKIYLKFDEQKSIYHAFRALNQDNENIEIISFVKENFSIPFAESIYKNRIEYLSLRLFDFARKSGNEEIGKYIQKQETKMAKSSDSFCMFLLMDSLDIGINISLSNRKRLAYIINFIQGQPWQTYYIIKNMMSPKELNVLDGFFYMLSSHQIGEPEDELKKFAAAQLPIYQDVISQAYNQFALELNKAIESNNRFDPYLFKLEERNFNFSFVDADKITEYHPWINEALKHFFRQPKEEYKQPISESQRNAMLSQYLTESAVEDLKKLTEQQKNVYWRNFLKSLPNPQFEFLVDDLIMNIRFAVQSGIPFRPIVAKIKSFIEKSSDENLNTQLLIATTSAYYSDILDIQKTSLRNNSADSVLGYISGVLYNEGVEGSVNSIIASTFLQEGVSSVFDIATAGAFKFVARSYEKYRKLSADEVFEELVREAKSISS